MNCATRWHEVPDLDALRQAALEYILTAAQTAIRERGEFHIVLAGGVTPRAVYAGLRDSKSAWGAWHVYYGDERCLPADDVSRNSRMAGDAWLDHVAIPPSHAHVIPAELGAARGAEACIADLHGVGEFDLVLLGLGEDGHTASLFPGHDWGTAANAPDALPVFDAPKPPPERISLSAARLSRTRQALFLVAGESKHQAVAGWRAGRTLPAREISPANGVDVVVESTLLAPLECRQAARDAYALPVLPNPPSPR